MKKVTQLWAKQIKTFSYLVVAIVSVFSLYTTTVSAYTPPPPVNPQSTGVGLTGTIPSNPPQTAASISFPSNGQVFTTLPIVVRGLCTSGLLIKLYINAVFSGAAQCTNNSYSITSALFNGTNILVAKDFDNLNQEGPDSNSVTVTFNNSLAGAGPGITLTSNYAKLGANPGDPLTWPIVVSGGDPSYAITIIWGDGKPETVLSQNNPGVFNIIHTYVTAGIYTILIKAVDAQGNIAYLQLVGVGNGPASQSQASTNLSTPSATKSKGVQLTSVTIAVMMIAIILVPILAFWLGSRHMLISIKKKYESGEGLEK